MRYIYVIRRQRVKKGRNLPVGYVTFKVRGTPVSVALLLMLERAVEKMLVAHLVKKFSLFLNLIVTIVFTEQPAPLSYPEPVESSSHFYNPFL